jgi:NAD-dependent dihydropyrimidine dehydrogenase PreA subunit
LRNYAHLERSSQRCRRTSLRSSPKSEEAVAKLQDCGPGGRGNAAIVIQTDGQRRLVVNEAECCNLCALVCPVEDCLTLVRKTAGVDPRTGLDYARPPADWTAHPNNPGAAKAAE